MFVEGNRSHMNEYTALEHGAKPSIVQQRLVEKGKAILELCLERDKNLCMKGFIDCQIEKGGIYLHVVDAMIDHVDGEITNARSKRRRELLQDLQAYAAEQLRLVGSETASA
jgi:hypothetical protein